MLGKLWTLLFKTPITYLLLWLSSVTGSMGLAIILLTIIVQLFLLPLRIPSLKSAQKLANLKPRLDQLKKTHAQDQMALARAQMELYKEHGVSPLGGILPMLFSIPVIIALYRVLLTTLQNSTDVPTNFLWLNLTQPDPYFVLPIVVGLSQWIMTRLMRSTTPARQEAQPNPSRQGKENAQGRDSAEELLPGLQKQMQLLFPMMSAFIVATLPSGVGVYWLTSTLFAALQQKVFVVGR